MPTEESQGAEEPQSFTNFGQFSGRAEDFARQEPVRAVGFAFLAGLVLTLLPIGAIVAGLLRLAFSLIRPALLILGAVKVYDEVQKRQ